MPKATQANSPGARRSWPARSTGRGCHANGTPTTSRSYLRSAELNQRTGNRRVGNTIGIVREQDRKRSSWCSRSSGFRLEAEKRYIEDEIRKRAIRSGLAGPPHLADRAKLECKKTISIPCLSCGSSFAITLLQSGEIPKPNSDGTIVVKSDGMRWRTLIPPTTNFDHERLRIASSNAEHAS